jgi:Flp pilus assembly protein TadB
MKRKKRKKKERKTKVKEKENEKEEKEKGKKKERKKARRRKRRRKGKENGEERGRKGRGKGKKDRVSHGPFLMPKVIVFVIVLLSFVNPVYVPFFWKWLQSSKKECSDHLPGTFLVQNLRHYDNKQ